MSFPEDPTERDERPRYRDYNTRSTNSKNRPRNNRRRNRDGENESDKKRSNRSHNSRHEPSRDRNGRRDKKQRGNRESRGANEFSSPHRDGRHRNFRVSPYDMPHREPMLDPPTSPPYLRWLGIWEVRGESRWNGSQMEVSVVHNTHDYEIVLKDLKRVQEFKLVLNPQIHTVAYWHMHDKKKSTHRKYSGTLLGPHWNKVIWHDMHRRRRVDDWYRLSGPANDPTSTAPRALSGAGRSPNTLENEQKHRKRKDDNGVERSKSDPSSQKSRGRSKEKEKVYQPKDPALREEKHGGRQEDGNGTDSAGVGNHDHMAIESQLASKPWTNNHVPPPSGRQPSDRAFGRKNHRGNREGDFSRGERPKFQLIPSPQRSSPQMHHGLGHHHVDPVLNDPAVLQFGSPQLQYNRDSRRSPNMKPMRLNKKRAKYPSQSPYGTPPHRHSQVRMRSGGRRDKQAHRRRPYDDRRGRRIMRHKQRSRKPRYMPHVKGVELQRLLDSGTTFEGTIRILPNNPYLSHVDVPELKRFIRVEGLIARNRAFHGDKVAVKLLPFKEWKNAVNVELMEFERRLDARSEQMREDRDLHELDDEEDFGSASDDGTIYDGVDVDSVLEDVEDLDHLDEHDNDNGTTANEVMDGFSLVEAATSESPFVRGASMSSRRLSPPDATESVRRINDLIVQYMAEENEVVAALVAQHISPVLGPSPTNMLSELKPKQESVVLPPLPQDDDPNVVAREEKVELVLPDAEEGQTKVRTPSARVMLSLISQFTQNAHQEMTQSALTKDIWESIPHPNEYLGYTPIGRVISVTESMSSQRLDNVSGYLEPIMPKKQHGRISDTWAMFVPLDKRMPKALFNLRECPRELEALFDQPERLRTFFLETEYILPWDEWNTYCTSRFVRMLGQRGDIETETQIILNSAKIHHSCDFGELIAAECADMRVEEEEVAQRKDCRDWPVFTIDPVTAQDFDDAISVVKCENQFEIGIHIADVTHFVKPGSELDREASDRATSVYLVDRCIPMLPHALCHDLCSLNPGVDRYAFSVVFRLTQDANVVENSVWFGRTIIRSKARLDYMTAHEMIVDVITKDFDEEGLPECVSITKETGLEEVIGNVKCFWELASKIRQRRFEDGSVRFSKPSIRFRLDSNHHPVLVGTDATLHSQSLIEEFMLMANKLVAKRLVKKCRDHALLRRHPPPNQEGLQRIKLIARSQRLRMDMSSSRKLNECLDEWDERLYGDNVSARSILVNMITKKMRRAEYFCVADTEEIHWRHFGLNFDMYTHFTSPIRRYADVIVHRLLQSVLTEQTPTVTSEDVRGICNRCNERAEGASKAEFESQKVHLCLYVLRNPIVVEAFIVDMRRQYFIVVVPVLGIQTDVRLSRIGAANATILLQPPDSQLVIQWHADDREETYQLFSKIQLRLCSELATPIRLISTVVAPEHRLEIIPSLSDQQRTNEANSSREDFLYRPFD